MYPELWVREDAPDGPHGSGEKWPPQQVIYILNARPAVSDMALTKACS